MFWLVNTYSLAHECIILDTWFLSLEMFLFICRAIKVSLQMRKMASLHLSKTRNGTYFSGRFAANTCSTCIIKIFFLQVDVMGIPFLSRVQVSKIQCPVCSKEFSSAGNAQRHYKIIHLQEKYKCECGEQFQWPNQLQRHKTKCDKAVFRR